VQEAINSQSGDNPNETADANGEGLEERDDACRELEYGEDVREDKCAADADASLDADDDLGTDAGDGLNADLVSRRELGECAERKVELHDGLDACGDEDDDFAAVRGDISAGLELGCGYFRISEPSDPILDLRKLTNRCEAGIDLELEIQAETKDDLKLRICVVGSVTSNNVGGDSAVGD